MKRIAYTELYLTLSLIFRRFDLELYSTVRARDVDLNRDCFLSEPMAGSKGIRVRVVGDID